MTPRPETVALLELPASAFALLRALDIHSPQTGSGLMAWTRDATFIILAELRELGLIRNDAKPPRRHALWQITELGQQVFAEAKPIVETLRAVKEA